MNGLLKKVQSGPCVGTRISVSTTAMKFIDLALGFIGSLATINFYIIKRSN